MKRMLYWFVLCLLMVVAGCITSVDPVTGQQQVGLDPNAPAIFETATEVAVTVAPLFGPVGTGIGGILAGLLIAWRKVKPQLVKAKSEAEQYHAAASAVVTGLESFKATNPDQWEKLGDLIEEQLSKQGIDPKTIENVIRALRGLPPKS